MMQPKKILQQLFPLAPILKVLVLIVLASTSRATTVEEFNSPPLGNVVTEEVITFDTDKGISKEMMANYKKIIPASRTEINKEDYPIMSRRLREEGAVNYSVMIRPNGSVAEVKIIGSPYPRLSDVVKASAIKWKFRPINLPHSDDVLVGYYTTTFSLTKKP